MAALGEDCNDADPSIHPGADEDCTDLVDRNCDGSVGDADLDGDGAVACNDCDDTEPTVLPGGEEVCDGLDNDCNGSIDEGLPTVTHYLDADSDGYGLTASTRLSCAEDLDGYSMVGEDCDDSDPLTYPDAPEECGDSVDYNCDGDVDATDSDGDGSPSCADCDDSDPAVSPDGAEVCDGLRQ